MNSLYETSIIVILLTDYKIFVEWLQNIYKKIIKHLYKNKIKLYLIFVFIIFELNYLNYIISIVIYISRLISSICSNEIQVNKIGIH